MIDPLHHNSPPLTLPLFCHGRNLPGVRSPLFPKVCVRGYPVTNYYYYYVSNIPSVRRVLTRERHKIVLRSRTRVLLKYTHVLLYVKNLKEHYSSPVLCNV